MKRKTAGSLIVIAALSVVTPALPHNGPLAHKKTPGTGALPDLIRTAAPQRRDFAETLRWFGKVESRDKARIVALETGRIVSMAARHGMPVTKGEVLFTIGGPLIHSRMEVLRGKSSTLRERIALAEQMVKIKRDAVSQELAKHEEFSSAEDLLARLKAELASIGQEIQRLQVAVRVRAPLTGVWTKRYVSVGQEVLRGDNLADIIAMDHLYIAAKLFPKGDADLAGKRAVVHLPSGNSIPGAITRVLPERTAEGAAVIWIEGSNLGQVLRPGETATGIIVLSVHKKALAVPQAALVRDEKERAYVFLKGPSGYARKPVKTGLIAGGMVEITSGIKEGDEVVVYGAYELFNENFKKIFKVTD